MRPQLVLLALTAGGLVIRLRKAWDDLPTLLLQATPDDAFYYFQIARNIANGRNVTFDGENLTNGFHPLWAAVLTPIYFISDDRELALHLGLTVGALLGGLTVPLVYAIVKTLTKNGWPALVAAAFYALQPRIIADSVNGMETALAVFLVALTVLLYLRLASGDKRPPLARYVWLGVAAGFMVLARTDTAFILLPILLHVMLRERGSERWWAAPAAGGSALLVVAPWAIWSLVSFGTVVQVSGVAVPDIQRQAFLSAHGSSVATQLKQAWDVTNEVFLHQLPQLFLVPRGGPRVPALLAGAGVIGFMLLAPLTPQRPRVARQLGLLFVPTAGIIAMLLFHSAIRWHFREWYFGPVGLVAAVLLGIALDYADSLLSGTRAGWSAAGREQHRVEAPQPSRAWRRAWTRPALYAVAVLALAGLFGPLQSDRWVLKLPHRVNMLEGARWLEQNTDPDARIGSFNAGIFGYFSERTVINLDGVVNEDAYKARRVRRTLQYICDQDIGYIVDLEMGAWVSARCKNDPSRQFELVTTIGRMLPYFGGGRVSVLELVPVRTATSSNCVASAGYCTPGSASPADAEPAVAARMGRE